MTDTAKLGLLVVAALLFWPWEEVTGVNLDYDFEPASGPVQSDDGDSA